VTGPMAASPQFAPCCREEKAGDDKKVRLFGRLSNQSFSLGAGIAAHDAVEHASSRLGHSSPSRWRGEIIIGE
jgi:hypothetical protein